MVTIFFAGWGPGPQKVGTIFLEGWDPGFRFSGPMDGVGWGPGFVPQATALWRWSNYLQHMDPPDKIRVLVNVDETSVRLVPQECKGHVSKGAYRLLCSGMPLGRNASLAAQRSAITHIAAICDHPEIQKRS